MKKPKDFSTRDEWEKFLWGEILEKLSAIRSKEDMSKLLDQLMSSHEKKLLLRRATIMFMLRDKMSYREIGKILWTSPLTVRSVKEAMGDSSIYKSRRSGRSTKKFLIQNGQNEKFTGKVSDVLGSLLSETAKYLINLNDAYSDASKRWAFLNKKM